MFHQATKVITNLQVITKLRQEGFHGEGLLESGDVNATQFTMVLFQEFGFNGADMHALMITMCRAGRIFLFVLRQCTFLFRVVPKRPFPFSVCMGDGLRHLEARDAAAEI